jgi:hypothetical protein
VHLATQLTEHLLNLGGHRDGDAALRMRDVAAGMVTLVEDLLAEVPSCLSVSLVLHQPAGDVTVSVAVAASGTSSPAVVRASLAVSLAAPAEATLLLQAARAGAFLLLADDLVAHQDSADPVMLIDEHLVLLTDPDGHRLAADLADLRVVERAVGALIEQGWSPAEARHELHERAAREQVTPPAVARSLLAAPSVPAVPSGPN